MGASFIDGLTLLVPNFIVDAVAGRVLGTVLSVVISASYVTLMLSRNGQTVGNMAASTRVVDARTGSGISPARALGRWSCDGIFSIGILIASINASGLVGLLVLPVLLDALWPLWDSQNQTLHDKIASTLVLRV